MVVSITTVNVKLDKLDEAAEVWPGLVEAEPRPGLIETYYVQDRQTGEVIVIGLWESEADANRGQSDGSWQRVRDKLEPFLDSAPRRKVYEVAGYVGENAACSVGA